MNEKLFHASLSFFLLKIRHFSNVCYLFWLCKLSKIFILLRQDVLYTHRLIRRMWQRDIRRIIHVRCMLWRRPNFATLVSFLSSTYDCSLCPITKACVSYSFHDLKPATSYKGGNSSFWKFSLESIKHVLPARVALPCCLCG